ncbi:hypothetical protein LCGC14_0841450 [marine sediment metagenome]|uniref:Uncharacterized protein n=1 Tax=marine sediment metagenome TaxID=412755 RepID=A0A0F9SKA4_9ZZZZ
MSNEALFYAVVLIEAVAGVFWGVARLLLTRYPDSYLDRPSVRFEKHDLWVGLYWDRWRSAAGDRPLMTRWTLWVCVVPTIVVTLRWHHGE